MSNSLGSRGNIIFSSSDDEKRIISSIMILYNSGDAFDCDPTYSKGVFWRGLPEPLLKYDLNPTIEGVERQDCRNLPLEDESISSIMFDPPFIIQASKTSKIANRLVF